MPDQRGAMERRTYMAGARPGLGSDLSILGPVSTPIFKIEHCIPTSRLGARPRVNTCSVYCGIH